jgi:hypothetical protein
MIESARSLGESCGGRQQKRGERDRSQAFMLPASSGGYRQRPRIIWLA